MKSLRILTLALLFVGGTTAFAVERTANGIAVLVNESIITYQDLEMFIGPALDSLRRQYLSEPVTLKRKQNELERDGIEQLVERRLILDEFKAKGYNLPDSIIEDVVQERIKKRFGDRIKLTKTLKAEGITYETFRNQLREDFVVEAMRSKNVAQEFIMSPAKIEGYYAANPDKFKVENQVKLSLIVLNRTTADDAGTTRKRAEEILFKLKEGAHFAEMAKIHSEGSQRAQGGDWGWVEKSVLRPELAAVAFALKPGQLSEVITTPQAYYLMKVEEARDARLKTLPEVRDEIEKSLIVQERSRLQKIWTERLKNKAFVRFF